MALKMRFLYYSSKAKIKAMADVVKQEFDLGQNHNAIDIIPPAYSCENERLVILAVSGKGDPDDIVRRFCSELNKKKAQNIALLVDGDEKTELTRSNIGINPELIASPQDKQPDFDAFWEQTLAELAAVEPEYTLTLLEEHSNDVRRTYRVDMKSFGGESISGVYVEPVKPGKYSTTIYYMGYNSDLYYQHPSSNPEMVEFTLCVRGQALNEPEGERVKWVAEGLESKESYYYRGAFADVVRAIDFVCSREKTDISRVFAQGESQGGALTLAAASLDDRFRAVAPSAPFLCDYPDYFLLAGWPGDPIEAAAKEAGIRDKVKIMIGGAPINQEFCEKIGADKYTSDAASAADAAIELLA